MDNLDLCEYKNGGCDNNATCSHDSPIDVANCTCKPGYRDSDPSPTNVVCIGKSFCLWGIRCIEYMRLDNLDLCEYKNGGCDNNATCSHDSPIDVANCTCKPGYRDSDPSPTNVVCIGKSFYL